MSNPKKEDDPMRIRGRGLLVAIVLVFAAGLVFLVTRGGDRPTGRRLVSGTNEAGSRAAPELAPLAAPPPLEVPAKPREGELDPFASARTRAGELAGKLGSLRGHLQVSGEEPFPEHWRLVLRPSLILPGREHAVARTLEFTDGRRDFAVPDVPLGGYDVSAEATRFNGPALSVLLEPGNEHPFVNLILVPAGTLDGRVLDAHGTPAEGVAITLFGASSVVVGEAWTDAGGIFRFEHLPDGPYDLLVGKATSPLLPERRPVRFMAPHLTFPDIELPLLGELHVRVVDSYARPLDGVEVRGSGSNGGLVEGRTDFDGRLVARHLPPGRFRLRLEHPAFAREYARRVAVDVEAGRVAEAPVRLGP
jgi:hypothetical protein